MGEDLTFSDAANRTQTKMQLESVENFCFSLLNLHNCNDLVTVIVLNQYSL